MMFKDNYDETQKALAQFILDHAPAGLRDHQRKELQSFVEGGSGRIYGMEFRKLSRAQVENDVDPTDFYAGDLQCTLYAEIDSGWDKSRLEDEEGNIWFQYGMDVKLNWPSGGSAEPGLAGERLAFMDEVCQFAKQILVNFPGPVYSLYMSKAKREEMTRNAERSRRTEILQKSVSENAYRMLVGQQRTTVLKDPEAKGWSGHEEVVTWGRPNGDVWKFVTKVIFNVQDGLEEPILIFSRTE